MTKRAAFTLLVVALVLGGCYKRTPLTSATPSPATRIVATLTDSGTVAMGAALGAGALEIEGVVSSADERQWTLELLRVDHRDDRSIAWNRERVSFPRTTLTNPFAVVLDKKRTWLAVVGVTVGAFLVARGFDLLGASEDEGDPPPPPLSVVPILPGGGNQ